MHYGARAAQRARVRALFDRGAVFFLCGDGRWMAPAVRKTLEAIYQEHCGCDDATAAQWLRTMEREGRFVADVFS